MRKFFRLSPLLIAFALVCSLSSCAGNKDGEAYEYNNSKLPSGRLSYTAPKNWIKEKPSSPMRLDQYALVGANGLADALVTVSHFPGTGGSIERNIYRWLKQFDVPEDKKDTDIEQHQLNIGKIPVTSLYVAGTYLKSKMPMMPSSPIERYEEYAMVGIIAETEEGPWFIKAIGPRLTIKHWTTSIEELMFSFRIDK